MSNKIHVFVFNLSLFQATVMWKCLVLLFLVILLKNRCLGLSLRYRSQRVCVVGAGYSGLGTARYLQQFGVNFTVFEATKYVGGTWRFDPHVGQDEDGVPVFTSMYKGLRTNTPRQMMDYLDFPLPEHLPPFPAGTCFYKYLEKFARHFQLLKYIQFRSLVTSIKWNHGNWDLTYTRTDSKTKTTEMCDFVVVATGYIGKPNIPYFEGQENFEGKIIHSHDYKDERPYAGRKVVVVGDGPSGIDIVDLLADVTDKIILSHHHNLNLEELPSKILMKPDIKVFTEDGIVFQDGTFEEVDDVILCTGFNFNNDILDRSTELGLSPKLLMPLYHDIVNIKHPSMVFVGKSKTSILRVYDAQAEYAAALAANKFRLPSEEVMLRSWLDHMYTLLLSGFSVNDINSVPNITSYFTQLAEEAGVYRSLPDLGDWLQKEEEEDDGSNRREDDCPDIS